MHVPSEVKTTRVFNSAGPESSSSGEHGHTASSFVYTTPMHPWRLLRDSDTIHCVFLLKARSQTILYIAPASLATLIFPTSQKRRGGKSPVHHSVDMTVWQIFPSSTPFPPLLVAYTFHTKLQHSGRSSSASFLSSYPLVQSPPKPMPSGGRTLSPNDWTLPLPQPLS